MEFTINDVQPKIVNGEIVELSDAEKQATLDKWNAPDTRPYFQKRLEEYPSINDLIVALWEGVVEERMSSVMELEAQRQAVKAKYPKGE